MQVPTVYDNQPNARFASATFQVLAAAAPIAGGSLEHAWCADGAECIQRAAAELRVEDANEQALRDLTVAEGPVVPGMRFNS